MRGDAEEGKLRRPAPLPGKPARDATESLAWIFLGLGCVLGICFAILMPPLQVPDEVAHLYRSLSVSDGSCLPPDAQTVPLAISRLQILFPAAVERQRLVHFEEYRRLMRTAWSDGPPIPVANLTGNIYSCAPYIASAAAIELAKLSSQSAIVLFYSARLANLAAYLALVYVALRIAPVGRPVFFCLALMPTAIHLAASVSADALTIASAFLLIAYVLYLAFDPLVDSLSMFRFVILGGLVVFATLCKSNLWFVLLLLLIPSSKFGSLKRKLLAGGAAVAVVVLVSAAWQTAVHDNMMALVRAKTALDIDVNSNLRFILHQPGVFLASVGRSGRLLGDVYATQFVGCLGWLSVSLPKWLVESYLGFLLIAALVSEVRVKLTAGNRLICAVVVAGSLVSVFALLWVFEMRQEYLATAVASLHRGAVQGVQGRYFIPFAPLLFLLLPNTRIRVKTSWIVAACIAMVVISGGIGISTVYKAYYSSRTPRHVLFSQLGVFRPTSAAANTQMAFYLNPGGSNAWDGAEKIRFFGVNATPGRTAKDIAVVGDWDGTGAVRVGVFHCPAPGQPGTCTWFIDLNNNGRWDGTAGGDAAWTNFGLPGDIPVVGDWNGTGISKIGVFRCPAGSAECVWYLDRGNKHTYDPATIGIYRFGFQGDLPVVGTWVPKAASPADQIGVFRCGTPSGVCVWVVDSLGRTGGNELGVYCSGPGKPVQSCSGASAVFTFTAPGGFAAGDVPVIGNWNGNGKLRMGIFRSSIGRWFVDTNGNGVYDPGVDQIFDYGLGPGANPGGVADQPIVGFWTMP